MIRALVFIGMLMVAAGLGFYASERTRQPSPVVESTPRPSPALRIEQVQELAALVTLHVPISDLQVAQLAGLTGSVKMVLAVHGDVDIATDLTQARFEDMDPEAQTALLVLPRPKPVRPRLDHERTRVVDIHRTGLWKAMPGQAGEEALTNQAMRDAQRVLGEAARNHDLVKRGCGHTERIIGQFFGTLGWSVQVQWDDTDDVFPSPEANSLDNLLEDRGETETPLAGAD